MTVGTRPACTLFRACPMPSAVSVCMLPLEACCRWEGGDGQEGGNSTVLRDDAVFIELYQILLVSCLSIVFI